MRVGPRHAAIQRLVEQAAELSACPGNGVLPHQGSWPRCRRRRRCGSQRVLMVSIELRRQVFRPRGTRPTRPWPTGRAAAASDRNPSRDCKRLRPPCSTFPRWSLVAARHFVLHVGAEHESSSEIAISLPWSGGRLRTPLSMALGSEKSSRVRPAPPSAGSRSACAARCPAIQHQALDGLLSEADVTLFVVLGGPGDEMLRQAADFVATLAQRGSEAHDVQPIEQISPNLPACTASSTSVSPPRGAR